MNESGHLNRELKFRRRMVILLFIGAASTLVWRIVTLQLHESEFLQSHGDARYLRLSRSMPIAA